MNDHVSGTRKMANNRSPSRRHTYVENETNANIHFGAKKDNRRHFCQLVFLLGAINFYNRILQTNPLILKRWIETENFGNRVLKSGNYYFTIIVNVIYLNVFSRLN